MRKPVFKPSAGRTCPACRKPFQYRDQGLYCPWCGIRLAHDYERPVLLKGMEHYVFSREEGWIYHPGVEK